MRKHPCSCWRVLFSALLLLACATAFLLPQAAEAAEPSLWLYRERTTGLPEEQAADWARSAMQEDEHWGIFAFPQRPPTREESHTVWLTTKLSEASPEKDTLLFGTTGQSVKVWLDDTVIYSFGTMGPARTSEGRTWHYVPLPPDAAGHQLTVECYSPFPRELGSLYYFSMDTAAQNAARVFLLDTTFIVTLPVALAMFIVVLFFYAQEKSGRRLYRALLAFLGIFIVWAFSGLESKFLLMGGAKFWWYVMTLAAYLLPVTANFIIYEILDGKRRTGVRWIIRGYVLLMGTAIVAELLGWHGLKNLMGVYFTFILIYEPLAFYWTFRAAQEGSRYCRAFLVPIGGFTLLAVVDGINFFWPFLPMNFFVSPFGIFALAAFLLAVLRQFVIREHQLGKQADSFQLAIQEAREREEYDTLTHCLSRTMFRPLLSGTLRDAQLLHQPLSIIMLDIDHFKGFNDTYGHEAGDEVLAGFAAAIRHELPAGLPFVRWGGEEFVILCPGHDLAAAARLAEKLRVRIATLSLHAQLVTTSVGVATWKGTLDTEEALFRRVDGALYRAKEGGRNCVELER